MEWHVSGHAINPDKINREIICIRDLEQDSHLKEAIENVKLHFKKNPKMSEYKKLEYLNQYIDEKMWNYKKLDNLPSKFEARKEVALGDFLEEQAGVCRHRALFMKVLADHLGLKAKLVRGWYGSLEGGPHAWNVFKLQDGAQYLVDPMHQKICSIDKRPFFKPSVLENYNAGFKGIDMRTGLPLELVKK